MKVKFSRCNSNSLANVPQVDGQLIYVKDTSEVYMDVGNNRNKLSDVIEVADITNVQNPIISKIYYDEATENLYKYIDNEWKSLGGSFTPQVYFWDGNQQTGLTFWNNIMKINEDNNVVVLYTFSDFSLSAIIKIPQGTIKTKKVTNWYDYYDLASTSSNATYSAMKARIKFTIENDVITTYTIETTTVASMSVLETNKDYATPYVPLYDGSPANKKYVDDKCIPYQPFPSGLDTSHTTQAFITSIRALNLPAGSTYLGGVTLTDMPFNGNAEVEIYVYPNNVVYCVLRSANVAPYEWECNSHTFRGWEAVGKAYTDNALTNYVQNTDYATPSKGGVIKSQSFYGTYCGSDGFIQATQKNYSEYLSSHNAIFIGKGTLENVIDNSIIMTGFTAPTTATVGYRIGQLYLNTTDNKVYQLVSIDDSDSENIIYNWHQLICDTDYATNIKGGIIIASPSWGIRTSNGFLIGNTFNISQYLGANEGIIIDRGTLENIIDNSVLLKGSTAPTTSTLGYRIGQLYLNTTNNSVYQLIAIDDTDPNAIVYTWQQLVTISDLSNYTPASSATTFDNTDTGLQATNVQDAIEELLSKISTLETTVGQVDEILDEIIGENTDITDVVYTTTNFTLDPETGYYEVSGAGNWELSISFTKHSAGTVSLNYKGTKLAGMESYSYIYLDNVEDSIGSSSEYTNFDFENVTAGTHTIRIVVSSGDDRTNMSVKLLTQTN